MTSMTFPHILLLTSWYMVSWLQVYDESHSLWYGSHKTLNGSIVHELSRIVLPASIGTAAQGGYSTEE